MQRLFASILLAVTVVACADSLDDVTVYDHSLSIPVDSHGVEGVYDMLNFTRVEVRDPGAKVTVNRFNREGDAFHVPFTTLSIELSSGNVHVVSGKFAGNNELEFDGKTAHGRYFVLEPSGRFVAIKPPPPGGLQLLTVPAGSKAGKKASSRADGE